MKVAMYYNNKDVRIEELPKPQIGKGEILIKPHAVGICGSDTMEWYRIKHAPLVLGHEVAGEIAEVGEGANFQVGDRVCVTHHVPCNTCRYCMNGHHTVCETLRTTNFDPGGFSEFIRMPSLNVDRGVFPLPEGMSFEEGSFIEPLATIVRAQRLANLKPGQSVLVIGSGNAGILHILLAKARGAGKIMATDVLDYRLKAAKQFGADDVINAKEDVPSRVKELTGRGADLVIVSTGALPAMKQAIQSVDKGGAVVFFAVPPPGQDIPIDMNDLWKKEVRLLTTYGGPPQDMLTARDLLQAKRISVKEMITHRLPLERTGEGFKLTAEPNNSLKVIIEPQK